MKKQFLTAVITVIFAGLVFTGCSGKNPAAEASGDNYTVQSTEEYVADISADGTDEAVTKEPSVTEPEITYPEGQTGKETPEGQTVSDETQTDEGDIKTEGEEQQTKPSAAKPGTTTTQPETKVSEKEPVQTTVKPAAPAQPETQAATKEPAQTTAEPPAPVQPETQAPTKAPAQSTTKPAAPAHPETQAPTKEPTPTVPAQTETQAPTKAPETPKKKTMWDAPYDVEAIKAYMVAELKARGYEYYPEVAEKKYDLWVEKWGEESAKENYNDYCNMNPESSAWDNFCTATAGPNRYYDNINHCTVGHQHYNWSNPATGAGEKKNSEGLTSLEFYVNDAIDYWDHIYGFDNAGGFHGGGPNGGATHFSIYVEQFSDGCVIFYILA